MGESCKVATGNKWSSQFLSAKVIRIYREEVFLHCNPGELFPCPALGTAFTTWKNWTKKQLQQSQTSTSPPRSLCQPLPHPACKLVSKHFCISRVLAEERCPSTRILCFAKSFLLHCHPQHFGIHLHCFSLAAFWHNLSKLAMQML